MMSPLAHDSRLGIIGGTGAQGAGLALRWAKNGYLVALGSRDEGKAIEAATRLNEILKTSRILGVSNSTAACFADIVVLTVPYSAQLSSVLPLKDRLAGKILIDVTVPLKPPKVDLVTLPAGSSAALDLQTQLGDKVTVVSAFQNVSAHHLSNFDHPIDCDVLVCSNDAPARKTVIALAEHAGLRGLDAGLLGNSVVAEALTSVLISINKHYKIRGAGIRITGLPS